MQSLPHPPAYRTPHPHWGTVAATTAIIIAIEALIALTLLGTRAWQADPVMHLQDSNDRSSLPLGGLGAIALPPSL
jgi:hypothetical protein